MLTLVRLSLLLAAFTTLVSSGPTPPRDESSVYDNCSGKNPHSLPNNIESTPYYKPQVHVEPEDVLKNGTAWEEWLWIGHNTLPDGDVIDYGYKWARGDPTSANISHVTFIAWARFPNGTFYREIERGPFEYDEHEDGGFTYTIANNTLTWDVENGLWKVYINANGYIIESVTEDLAPSTPFAPSYESEYGQMSKDFYSTVDVTHGKTEGKTTFPWGPSYPIKSVGSLKHTWSYKIMADILPAYVRASTYIPETSSHPAISVTWFQAWDLSGKEIEHVQLSVKPDLRLQITDAPKLVNIVTTPVPAPPPFTFESAELTFPICGPGADIEDSEKKATWKSHDPVKLYDFLDFSNGVTLYRRTKVTGTVWIKGKLVEVTGFGLIEDYHR